MKLMRIGAVGAERPVVMTESGEHYDLTGLTDDIDGGFLATDGVARAREALAAESLPAIEVAGQRVGAPIARPQAVLCIGQNYAAHAAESGPRCRPFRSCSSSTRTPSLGPSTRWPCPAAARKPIGRSSWRW